MIHPPTHHGHGHGHGNFSTLMKCWKGRKAAVASLHLITILIIILTIIIILPILLLLG